MRRNRLLWLLILVPMLVLGCAWISGRLNVALHLHAMSQNRAEWQERGLWLESYRAGIQARPVPGVTDNLSGLTYSEHTDTLFAVINRPPGVIELSRDGIPLRHIALTHAEDPEGITHVAGTTFILSDERRNRISWFEITPETTEISLEDAPHLVLHFGTFRNMGFEGVSWDTPRDELLVAQEMMPVRVLRIRGLEQARAGKGLALDVSSWQPRHWADAMPADLSSLSAHDATGNLLLLSQQTGVLLEYTPEGDAISILPLWAGWHGLTEDIPQAEGLAVGPGGEIYLVSEPNLFYRFDRDPALPRRWR